MSVLMMSHAWTAQGLDPYGKLVLLALADFSNDDGVSWPSIPTIAQKSGVTENTVRQRIKSMESQGLLIIEARTDKKGRNTSYLFKIFPEGVGRVHAVNPPYPSCGEPSPLHAVNPPPSPGAPSYLNHHLTNKDLAVEKKPSTAKLRDVDQKAKAPDKKLIWFRCWFVWAVQELTGCRYLFNKADGCILSRLVKDLDFKDLVKRASWYLMLPDESRFPRGAPTVKGLAGMLGQIAGKDGGDACRSEGLLPREGNLSDFKPWERKEQYGQLANAA